MRKIISFICAVIVCLLFPAAILVARGLPADTRAYVSQKYTGWNGVLQAWVCCEWNAGGSFITWLNGCAAEFEKQHEGVYVEFITVGRDEVRAMLSGGLRAPELILFSPGMLESPEGLTKLNIPDELRSDLAGCGGGYAWPVAMGGYIWVYNRALSGGELPKTLTLPPDDAAHNYSAAVNALLSEPAGEAEIEYEQPGVDLGLPAYAAGRPDIVRSEDALDDFIDGEIPMTLVDQAGLARLSRLRENGRGPDWDCLAAGRYAYTDQLLMLAQPVLGGEDAGERSTLAGAFAAQLLEEDAQTKLAGRGACSVTGARVHSDSSAYARLDHLLNSRSLAAPDCFSEYSQRG